MDGLDRVTYRGYLLRFNLGSKSKVRILRPRSMPGYNRFNQSSCCPTITLANRWIDRGNERFANHCPSVTFITWSIASQRKFYWHEFNAKIVDKTAI